MNNKKRAGNISDILGTTVCLLFIVIIIVASINFYKLLEINKTINACARACLLNLETEGELSDMQIQSVTDTLNEIGITDIEITYNETNVKKEYGELVSVEIKCSSTYRDIGISQIYDFISEDNYGYKNKLYSTAKN